MPRSIGEGVNHDLVHDMGSWTPMVEDQETVDEKNRLNESGGGIEVGEKYKVVKERGVIKDLEKIPGELKKSSPEAVSKDLNPEEAMIARESMAEDELPPDNVEEVVGPSDGETDSDDELSVSPEEMWENHIDESTRMKANEEKPEKESFFASFFKNIGIKKSVAVETGVGPKENRKMDKRNGGKKPLYKDERKETSTF